MIDFSKVKKISIPEGNVKEITSGGVIIWKAQSYTNLVPLSIDSNGNIYNVTGYKEGYRVRSGGEEGAAALGVCTGYIPYKKGDILYIYPLFSGQNSNNAINFSDNTFANLGQLTDSGARYGICTQYDQWKTIAKQSGEVMVIDIGDVPNGDDIAYIRLTHHLTTAGSTASSVASGSELIVTVNEEIS